MINKTIIEGYLRKQSNNPHLSILSINNLDEEKKLFLVATSIGDFKFDALNPQQSELFAIKPIINPIHHNEEVVNKVISETVGELAKKEVLEENKQKPQSAVKKEKIKKNSILLKDETPLIQEEISKIVSNLKEKRVENKTRGKKPSQKK